MNKEIVVNPLSGHTGAEIRGIDLREDQDESTREYLRQLFGERSILVFRDQTFAPPDLQRAGEIFGEIMPQLVKRFTLPECPLVGFVSSDDTDKPGGKRMVRGEQYHTDHANFEAPPLATALYAVTLPRTGGDTQFVNVQESYADLPGEVRRRIDTLRVLHVFKSSRSPREKAELPEEDRKKTPETVQPLVAVHPRNGRKGLYLNTTTMQQIIGMGDDEAFALIDELMTHASLPKYEYRHKWLPGDFAIWDNRALMHQANGDYTDPRYLLRVLVKGEPLIPAS